MSSYIFTEFLVETFKTGPIVVIPRRYGGTVGTVDGILCFGAASSVSGVRSGAIYVIRFAGGSSRTRTRYSRVLSRNGPYTIIDVRTPNEGGGNCCRGTIKIGASSLRTGFSVLFVHYRGLNVFGLSVNSLNGRVNVTTVRSRVHGCIPCTRLNNYGTNANFKVLTDDTTSGVVATAISS